MEWWQYGKLQTQTHTLTHTRDKVKEASVWSFGKKIESQKWRDVVTISVCVKCYSMLTQALNVSEVSSVRFGSYNHSLTLRRSVFCSQLNGILAPFLNLNEDDS